MGHYDDCYEYDEEQRQKQRKKELLSALKDQEKVLTVLRKWAPTHQMDRAEVIINWLELETIK